MPLNKFCLLCNACVPLCQKYSSVKWGMLVEANTRLQQLIHGGHASQAQQNVVFVRQLSEYLMHTHLPK